MSYAPGALVQARGREWVVLPGSSDDLVLVRPLGGTDDETTGILPALEEIRPSSFPLPDPADVGDHRSCQLLRDALRLGFRSSAGPFRSFGQIAVDPRPYQLVPLLMALRQDRVRLLIADDVGVGKTVEALLVAKELLAQGDAQRLAVLTPPHLAEQWQREMREKFHIDAELVLPSTVGRLERGLPYGTSLFEAHPFVVVSVDFIKGDRYRNEFLRTCPELVIVDEAHGCTLGAERARQLRHALVKELARDPDRHLILVTATPHSGNEDAFRSLLALVEPSLADLPEDLSGPEHETHRRTLARFLVQRRRADIEHYLATETPFPKRDDREETYTLSPEYRRLFDKVLAYARERVRDPEGGRHRQRVRWWAVLGLLRALASSPAAAAATLRNRAETGETASAEEADEVGRRAVFDVTDEESLEGTDLAPGADDEPGEDEEARNRRRLRAMAREADALQGEPDRKLAKGIELVRGLVADGFRPIVFCRFIPTAEYVATHLREALGAGVEVAAVTGQLPAEEREARVLALAGHERRVLVATDCLSEGINLQDHFDAVLHYDLSWNPTRHEQREGRIDRFGQQRDLVRTITYYGLDNRIDGIVLDVLIRKSKAIRKSLGVSVPVPEDTDSVMEAIFEGLLLREEAGFEAERLPGFEEFFRPKREQLHETWDRSAEREKRSRTMFAQESLKPEEVERELRAVREAIGARTDVERFVRSALPELGATVRANGALTIDLSSAPRDLRDVLGMDGTIRARFELPVAEGETYLTRTHPLVGSLAAYVLDTSLDPHVDGIARRCGAIRTDAVERRTTLLLLRLRFDIVTAARAGGERVQLAEDAAIVAFEGPPDEPAWLPPDRIEPLLEATPTANLPSGQASDLVSRVVEGIDHLVPHLEETARARAEEIREAHARVRRAARATGVRTTVEPRLPVDVLGIYVLVPAPRSS
jgi:superfamily II DNA or RNA helicase